MIDWDIRFMELAHHVAAWSKDPSTKVGAVIVKPDKTIVSVGYNGFPRGVDDDPSRYDNRDMKYKFVVHAEANAILNANSPVKGCILYVTHQPCCECAKLIIQSGIKDVVTHQANDAMRNRFLESFQAAELMFKEAGVRLWKSQVM